MSKITLSDIIIVILICLNMALAYITYKSNYIYRDIFSDSFEIIHRELVTRHNYDISDYVVTKRYEKILARKKPIQQNIQSKQIKQNKRKTR